VTVFGSARFREDRPYDELARDVGRGVARPVEQVLPYIAARAEPGV
jgi:hypothetical protein